MKKRKNLMAKTVASIALLAIFISLVGTGLLVLVGSNGGENEITQEQLQEYIESLSGSVVSGSGQTDIEQVGENNQ